MPTQVKYNSGNNEWYTPSEYIMLAKAVMGSIDLDPASNAIANEVVQAKQYFSAEDDGLQRQWHGNVWLNPPYSSNLLKKFAKKLIEELPYIDNAIVLVNNATETEWFKTLVSKATAICFPYHRIKFHSPEGKKTLRYRDRLCCTSEIRQNYLSMPLVQKVGVHYL